MSLKNQLQFLQSNIKDFPSISLTTFRKFLVFDCDLRYKKISYLSKKADSTRNKQVRKVYIKLLFYLMFYDYKIVYVDSSAISNKSTKPYGWGTKKMKLTCPQKTSNKFYHFYVSMSMNGVEMIKHSMKSLRGEDLTAYLGKLIRFIKRKYATQKVAIVLDNATSHHSKAIQALFQKRKVICLYTPSNSPALNLVEYSFETLKREIRLQNELPR